MSLKFSLQPLKLLLSLLALLFKATLYLSKLLFTSLKLLDKARPLILQTMDIILVLLYLSIIDRSLYALQRIDLPKLKCEVLINPLSPRELKAL